MQDRQGPRRVQVVGKGGDNLRVRRGVGGVSGQDPPMAQRLHRRRYLSFGPVHRLGIMRGQQHEPDRLARHAPVQQVAHGQEIAEALRHLLAFDQQHPVVHPDVRKRRVRMGAGRLRDFVLVMREHQIAAAAVDVETFPQQCRRHRRTFDVPAGASAPPGTIPSRRFGVRGFPEHEIHRVPLVRGSLDPCLGGHVGDGPARQRPVTGETGDRKQHMTLRLVGIPAFHQGRDHCDHVADMVRGAGHVGRVQHPDRRRVFQIPSDRLIRDVGYGTPGLCRPCVDLVIDIGEVAYVLHTGCPMDVTQEAKQRIEDDRRSCVAQMRTIVNRRPADIHPHIPRVDGPQRNDASGLGVPQANVGHRPGPCCCKPPANAIRPGQVDRGVKTNERPAGDACQAAMQIPRMQMRRSVMPSV